MAGMYYSRLESDAVGERDLDRPLPPDKEDGDDPEKIAITQESFYGVARDLLNRPIGLKVISADATWAKLRPYALTVSHRLDALRLAHMVEGEGDRESVASFKDVLADSTLVAACLIPKLCAGDRTAPSGPDVNALYLAKTS